MVNDVPELEQKPTNQRIMSDLDVTILVTSGLLAYGGIWTFVWTVLPIMPNLTSMEFIADVTISAIWIVQGLLTIGYYFDIIPVNVWGWLK